MVTSCHRYLLAAPCPLLGSLALALPGLPLRVLKRLCLEGLGGRLLS